MAQNYKSENPLIAEIQIAASKMGGRLFRNTVGVFETAWGGKITSGLGVGSSDLIGFLPLQVFGITVPVFTAIEVKAERTVTTDAQKKFVKMVMTMNGVGAIVHSVNEFEIAAQQVLSSLKAQIISSKPTAKLGGLSGSA